MFFLKISYFLFFYVFYFEKQKADLKNCFQIDPKSFWLKNKLKWKLFWYWKSRLKKFSRGLINIKSHGFHVENLICR